MRDLRSKETHDYYLTVREARGSDFACPLCDRDAIQQFQHWKIIPNRFPYDRIAVTHHMIVSLRHVPDSELLPEEIDELIELKQGILRDSYDMLTESLGGHKSIPSHAHRHLITLKDFNDD